MAKIYELTPGQRLANKLFRFQTDHGRGADYRHILSVRGRSSGKLRSTPVDVMRDGDRRWLVAPYGEVNWVRNLRAAGGQLTLRRRNHVEHFLAREINTTEAIPVIRRYIRTVPVTSNYWDAKADSTDEEIAIDALHHPVFSLGAAIP